MNVALLPVPPLVFSASAANVRAGVEMKNQWIEQTLNEMHQVNEVMEKQNRRKATNRNRASSKASRQSVA
jgi:hypothetical protein